MKIISAERASRLDIPLEGKRGYLVVSSDISQNDFKEIVETRIVEAFHKGNRPEALQELNQFFIHTDLDFRDEFRKDLIPVEELRILIDSAFKTVVRGNGTTLHEAVAKDDYLSAEEILAARKKDTELHWRDVPSEHLADHPEFLIYLDFEGLRYYLPAVMMFALNCSHSTDNPSTRLLDSFTACSSSRCRQRLRRKVRCCRICKKSKLDSIPNYRLLSIRPSYGR
nr:DUF6714 family protein [Leptospira interrogans]